MKLRPIATVDKEIAKSLRADECLMMLLEGKDHEVGFLFEVMGQHL